MNTRRLGFCVVIVIVGFFSYPLRLTGCWSEPGPRRLQRSTLFAQTLTNWSTSRR